VHVPLVGFVFMNCLAVLTVELDVLGGMEHSMTQHADTFKLFPTGSNLHI